MRGVSKEGKLVSADLSVLLLQVGSLGPARSASRQLPPPAPASVSAQRAAPPPACLATLAQAPPADSSPSRTMLSVPSKPPRLEVRTLQTLTLVFIKNDKSLQRRQRENQKP